MLKVTDATPEQQQIIVDLTNKLTTDLMKASNTTLDLLGQVGGTTGITFGIIMSGSNWLYGAAMCLRADLARDSDGSIPEDANLDPSDDDFLITMLYAFVGARHHRHEKMAVAREMFKKIRGYEPVLPSTWKEAENG